MAKFFSFNGDPFVPTLIEDPRDNSNDFYFSGVRYDKTTLTPKFNDKLSWHTSSTAKTWQVNAGNFVANTNNYNVRNPYLHLSKVTVHCWDNVAGTGGHYRVPDTGNWRCMDPALEKGLNIQKITDGTSTTVMEWFNTGQAYHHVRGTPAISNNTSLSKTNFFSCLVSPASNHPAFITKAINGGGVFGFCQGTEDASSYYYPSFRLCAYHGSWPSSYSSYSGYDFTGGGSYWHVQFLGYTTDNHPLYVQTYASTGTDSTTIKINKTVCSGANTITQTLMATLGAGSATASGTHAGGYNRNNQAFAKACSKIFTDPRDANKKAFYYTYFDQYGAYHPFVITWDKTNDTFVVEKDISVTGLKSSDIFNSLTTTFDVGTYTPSGINTETWVSGGTRYVAFIQFCMKADSTETNKKYMVTYSVDPTNPKALTYHSHIIFDDIVRNYIWLNDSYTMFGVFHKQKFVIWSWDDTNGWVKTTTIPERVSSCGRDSMDRIWYTTQMDYAHLTQGSTTQAYSWADLHLLTTSIPSNIVITPETESPVYSGIDINTHVNVSAYDVNGNRIVATVKLVIDSTSYKFSDNTLTKTIVTSATADTQVNTVITGSGSIDITASIEL